MKDIFLMKNYIIYGFVVFWLSFSARSFSSNESSIVVMNESITASNESIVIRSDDSDCNEGIYEDVREQVLDVNNYHNVDDQIPWPRPWHYIMGDNRKPLDMTLSSEIPQTSSSSDESELDERQSQVVMAFSPAGLDRDYSRFYPRMYLTCSILESQENNQRSLNQTCQLIADRPSYAITSFVSDLQMIENQCGVGTLATSFEVTLSPHTDHVEEIYDAIIDYYGMENGNLDTVLNLFSSVLPNPQTGQSNLSLWGIFSSLTSQSDGNNQQQISFLQQTLFPVYFKKFFDQLVL